MRNIYLLVSAFFIFSAADAQTSASNFSAITKRELREITLTGTGYELGLQHGKLFKKEIGELFTKWKKYTTETMGRDANQVFSEFIRYANFTPAIKKWTPDLYEEIRGIADGSGQSMNDVLVFNLLDEFWVYQDNLSNHHCSGIGVPGRNGNSGYIAQNMDIESYSDGYQVLMRLTKTEKRPEQLILTEPGLIALNGMNETGIGACMNTLMQLKASSTGLPVAFIVRRILNSTDKEELLQFIQLVPHASGQNYIIGIRGEVYDFEASANKVVRFDPKNANGTIYHTNHPLANDDVKDWFKKFDPLNKDGIDPARSNSHIRLTAVQKRVKDASIVNDIIIKETLRSKDDKDNPVCRQPRNGGFTFGSVIMTLTGNPFLQVTAGPPDESEYRKIEFISKTQNK
jgi:predicted choloylglycine hydrolase